MKYNNDTKITLHFGANEMPYIEEMLLKYYGGKKFKTQRDRNKWLGMFISTFTNKGFYAVENNREYFEVA